MSALAPDAATALPGSAAAAVAWRAQGTLHVSVIAKATFAFASDAAMPRAEPQEILRAEVHHGSAPGRSVRFTTDLTPALARADVLFTGAAHAPPGAPVRSLPVRLALFADQRPLLDKRLVVHDPGGVTRVPLVYERTCLGLGDTENPFGLTPAAGGAIIVDPAQPGRPAGFAPLGRAWPARKRLLGAVPRRVLEGSIAEIPEGFDWTYFQAAPLDQRIDILRGDEWIILEGLHPSQPRFRTRLPGARASARVHGLSAFGIAEGQPLELHLDTLRIDGGAEQCTAVWRRSFPVAGEAALAAVRVVAGVAVGGEALAWVAPSAAARHAPGPAAPPAPAPGDDTEALPFGTLALGPTEETAPRAPALPFQPASLGQPSALPRREPISPVATGTLALSPPEDEDAAQVRALPFVAPVVTSVVTPVTPAPVRLSPEPASAWVGVAPPPWIGPPVTPAPASAPALAPDTVPYFVPPAATTPLPAAPAAPAPPDPGKFPLERYAALAAALAEQRTPREDLLFAEQLDEAAWRAIDQHWSEAIKRDAKQAAGKLRRAYDAAYVAAVEGLRGPITPAEYARLALAGERGQADEVLDELRIQRAARMSVIRVWTKRLAADGRLRAEVSAARAALLEE